MMVLFAYGITALNEYGIFFLIGSAILLVILIKVIKKAEEPMINLNLLRNKPYVIGNYAAMATYFTITIAITALSFHLQYIMDFEEYIVSLILIIAPIIMIGMSNISGKLSNKYDPRLISAIAMGFIFISMVMYAFVDQLPIELILLACAFQGLGNGLFSAPNNKYVLTIIDEKDLADGSSILSTSKEFGKIVSSGIYTLILSIYIGDQTLGPEYLDDLLIISTNHMMIICSIVAFSAMVLLLYSKYRFELNINKEIINLFKSITPKWLRRED